MECFQGESWDLQLSAEPSIPPVNTVARGDHMEGFNCSMRADRQQNSLEFGEAKVSNLGSV